MASVANSTPFQPFSQKSADKSHVGINQDEHLRLKMGDFVGDQMKKRLYKVASPDRNAAGRPVADFVKKLLPPPFSEGIWPLFSVAAGFGLGLVSGALLTLAAKLLDIQDSVLGPLSASIPADRSAVSAVTGGFPEDMNGMPANSDPASPDPVYV